MMLHNFAHRSWKKSKQAPPLGGSAKHTLILMLNLWKLVFTLKRGKTLCAQLGSPAAGHDGSHLCFAPPAWYDSGPEWDEQGEQLYTDEKSF